MNTRTTRNRSASCRWTKTPELGRDRAGDLRLRLQRRRQEGDAVAEAAVGHLAVPDRCGLVDRLCVGRVQVELGPLRARERPFVLVPLDELSRPDGAPGAAPSAASPSRCPRP